MKKFVGGGRVIMISLLTIIMFLGAIIVGSDGPFFPWPNLVGVVVVMISGWLLNRNT